MHLFQLFNSSVAKASRSLSSRPAWATEWEPDSPKAISYLKGTKGVRAREAGFQVPAGWCLGHGLDSSEDSIRASNLHEGPSVQKRRLKFRVVLMGNQAAEVG